MRIGELFSGYGGLGMGVQTAMGGEVVWHSDIDPGACKILAHRYPGVPNLGDFTTVDWTAVEPVDVLTAGFPCQPVSGAGRRQGVNDKRWLFDDIVRALGVLRPRPRLCVFENVLGLLSANGGDAMARVVQGLASVGYMGSWRTVRASDIGAPHRRERVFIVAHPADQRHDRPGRARAGRPRPSNGSEPALGQSSGDLVENGVAGGVLTLVDGEERGQVADGLGAQGDVSHEPMVSRPGEARNKADENPSRDFTLLPTPAVNDMGAGKTPEQWDEWTARMRAAHGNGNGHGKSLAIEAQRLLPTPTTQAAKHDADDGGPGTLDDSNLWSVAARIAKGQDDGLPAEGGPGEELRDVRDAADPQEVRQRQARGPGRVPAQEVLQPELREHQDDGDAVGSRAQSGEAQEASVRGLRGDRGSHPRPPQGPELAQRRPGEPADAVRVVSSEVALAGGPGATAGGEPLVDWGVYTDAIRRWEQVLGRPAPPPTQLSRKGTPQLSPRFSEFLMGLPDGWVTDVPGITRNEALRALGNGVVPQQATAALRYLLTVEVPA